MSDRKFQNGFQVFKENLKNLRHWKRNTYRHTTDDYTDVEELLD